MKNLVLVESPSKAHTINKYLGEDFIVKATVGHIKNLPKNTLGVDIKNDFEPKYEIIKGKEKTIEEIKKIAKNVETVYLAADPDREGEAIAWNIKEIIDTIKGKKPDVKRVLFNEITKDAIKNAIKNPTSLNEPMYESQKARRILDRLVGYNLSPFLWEKVRRGLSAGRVQSVALYLIVEREKEIKDFKKEEFWTVTALFDIKENKIISIECELFKINGKEPKIKNEEEVSGLKEKLLKTDNYKIEEIGKKQSSRKPPLPLITSTLQQEAAKILRFPVKKTMTIAQKLYEGVELGTVEGVSNKPLGPVGLITYMRTDSTRISGMSAAAAKNFIENSFGKEYLNKNEFNKGKGKAGKIQDAHEAIRPTDVLLTPKKIKEYLTPDEYKLYNLIWTYFVASLMSESIYDQYSIVIKGIYNEPQADKNTAYTFKTTESVLNFDGFQKVINESAVGTSSNIKAKSDGEEQEDAEASRSSILKIFALLTKGDPADIKKVDTFQHFTSPPPRYTEATLVKALDENGIGRPSTYQSIIANIKNKDYVAMTTESADASKKGGSTQKFKPTELGMTVSDILKAGFSDIVDLKFTANMEAKLDGIEKGAMSRKELLANFYDQFMKSFGAAKMNIKNIKGTSEPTDIICEKCGKPMVIKMGRFGKFLACSGYPECKNTKEIPKENAEGGAQADETDEICEKCGKPMVIKTGRYGKFLSCSGYPECKNIKPIPVKHNKSKIPCPTGCGGYLVEKRTKKGRKFYGCSNYPKCDYAAWTLPKLAEGEKSSD
ncbi:MAG: type I DNA topoisomerase [Candidatus Acidulodesulfobacterium ferriphilum]|uniref:DNA topoisomerase 1 n=1 Tax=Candidatus Acidulodesulfobacterium ferriphilum TaxID=2597223 RepID=A0A519BDR0_9DELT|nr:MAG: type I DNA topoisomerase [Candidatus Acidulodesulfobacterium ferriphilum]